MATPIRGETRPIPIKAGLIETQKLNANINASIHNRFDVEVIDTRTGKIRQRAHGENVICSQLWSRLFTPAKYFTYIHYGTGSGTPAATDTSLFTFLGYGTPTTADDTMAMDYANNVYSYRRKIRLDTSTANGYTLTEVGIGYSTTAATLCTHAMLKDANGNTISIVKTNTDIINIYATVYANFASFDGGTIVFNDFVSESSSDTEFFRSNNFFRYLCGIESNYRTATYYAATHGRNWMGGTQIAATTTYSLAAKTITVTGTRMEATANNIGGFCGIILSPYVTSGKIGHPWLYLKAGGTWMPGTNITGEAIGTGDGSTTKFSTDFGFTSNAKIYVDGVETSATVSKVPLQYSNMGLYFDAIVIGNNIAYPAIHQSPGNAAITDDSAQPTYCYYNPHYAYGIKSFAASNCAIEVSDDLATWVTLYNSTAATSTITVPAEYRNYKYWKLTLKSSDTPAFGTLTADSLDGYDIVFPTAPASGAAITADYHTDVIAKDVNHVFDFSMVIQLGEYTA